MKSFNRYITEELSTKEISVDEFPNPLRGRIKDIFKKKGELDGEEGDDVVKTRQRSFPAKSLKPSQSAIFLGKALGMAVGGVKEATSVRLFRRTVTFSTVTTDTLLRCLLIQMRRSLASKPILESVILCLCFVRWVTLTVTSVEASLLAVT